MAKINRSTKYGILILVAAATFYFLLRVRGVIAPFIAAGALAYLLYPVIEWLGRRGVGRGLSILLTYLVIIFLLAVGIWYTIPHLAGELSVLGEQIPRYMDHAQKTIANLKGASMPSSMEAIVEASIQHAETSAYGALQNFLNGIVGAVGSLLSLIFIPILAFYLTADWEKIRDGLLSLFTPELRDELARFGREIDIVLTGFIKGELLVSLLVGLFTGLAAYLLGSKYGIIIGIIMGIAELFPYFGPFLGAVPAIALALTQGPRAALYMGIAIFVIQQVESNWLSPKIVGSRVGLHPLVVVFALFAGGELFGIWGMLFAVPIAAVLKVAAKHAFYLVID